MAEYDLSADLTRLFRLLIFSWYVEISGCFYITYDRCSYQTWLYNYLNYDLVNAGIS